MQKTVIWVLSIGMIISAVFLGFSQEQLQDPLKAPPTLYPEPGPGDIAIVKELEETNRLLREQIQILQDQNRLLRQHLTNREQNSKQ